MICSTTKKRIKIINTHTVTHPETANANLLLKMIQSRTRTHSACCTWILSDGWADVPLTSEEKVSIKERLKRACMCFTCHDPMRDLELQSRCQWCWSESRSLCFLLPPRVTFSNAFPWEKKRRDYLHYRVTEFVMLCKKNTARIKDPSEYKMLKQKLHISLLLYKVTQ